VLCAELCGSGHALMRGRVIVQTQEEYQAWLGGQRRFAQRAALAMTDSTVALHVAGGGEERSAR
jgi:cytochrome c oxidase subunit 2